MDKKDFWTTLPGILTGIAAILSAITGIYLAVRTDDPPEPRPGSIVAQPPAAPRDPEARAGTSVSEWPVSVNETFSDARTQWPLGNYPEGALVRFELSVAEGAYRWDLDVRKDLSKSINAPLGFVTDFSAAVDVVVRQHSVEPIDIGLLFGVAEGRDFRLLLKSPGLVGVSRAVGTTINDMVVGWVPVDAPLDRRNRMAVVVAARRMSFYMNDRLVATYRDDQYTGGSLGLSVGAYSPGTAIIEFDNFELRRRP